MASREARPDAVEQCFQRTVRDRASADADIAALFPSPDNPDVKQALVIAISRRLAMKVISHFEWLGTLPPCKWYFGIFFDGYCGGVACYRANGGGAPQATNRLGVGQNEIAYLCRGACVHWAPKGTAPRIINLSGKMTGQKLALAYADPDAGEIGTVYQASGWSFIGRGAPSPCWRSPQGRLMHNVLPKDIARRDGITHGEATRILLDGGWTKIITSAKLRYCKILPAGSRDKRLCRRIAELSLPYPKRPASTGVAGSPQSSGEGRSTRSTRSNAEKTDRTISEKHES